MTENVVKVLKANVWSVATCSDVPNVVPVGFKDVTEDGLLVVGDVMMDTTMKNVQANGKIAISAFDPKTSEGYQVKGTAVYHTEGPVVDALREKAMAVFQGAMTVKGALVITPDKVIVTSPGPDNKKVL